MYKSPDDKGPYRKITEKIDYNPSMIRPNRTAELKIRLKRPMVWRHQLYTYIGEVKMGPVPSAQTIVQLLQQQQTQTYSSQRLLQHWSPSFKRLNKMVKKLKSLSLSFSKAKKTDTWQTF